MPSAVTTHEYAKGGEIICLLRCRWHDHAAYQQVRMGRLADDPASRCKAALGGFNSHGHCPCRAHEPEVE